MELIINDDDNNILIALLACTTHSRLCLYSNRKCSQIVFTIIYLSIYVDAPWCEIRPTHASSKFVTTHFLSKKKERWENGVSVKSRNEPRNIL